MKKEVKDKVLRIRMTTSMYEKFGEIAKSKGTNISALIRKWAEERSEEECQVSQIKEQ